MSRPNRLNGIAAKFCVKQPFASTLKIEPAIGPNPDLKCPVDFKQMYFFAVQSMFKLFANARSTGCIMRDVTTMVMDPCLTTAVSPCSPTFPWML